MIRSINEDVGWELHADARLVQTHEVFYTFSIANLKIVLLEIVGPLFILQLCPKV